MYICISFLLFGEMKVFSIGKLEKNISEKEKKISQNQQCHYVFQASKYSVENFCFYDTLQCT